MNKLAFLRDGVVGFVYWTLALTPIMLLVVQLDGNQYTSWLVLQAVLGPPLGALSAWVFRREWSLKTVLRWVVIGLVVPPSALFVGLWWLTDGLLEVMHKH